jgi:hypothetical protein
VIRTARPYVLAVTLLATIFTATVIWASTPPSPAAATPANILGKDGRYTLLFLGSDKRCAKRVGKKMIMTERCDTGTAEATEWNWSPRNDKAYGVPKSQIGSERTDVILLLTVDPFSGQTAAYSIPRDLYGFPLKPSIAKSFGRAGSKIFNDKINALFVRAQQYARTNMTKSQAKAWDSMLAWERSVVAGNLVAENIAFGLGIEIDDWTLTTFGTADIMGATLDRLDGTVPADTIVQLDDKTRFAACRANALRKIRGSGSTEHDQFLASNAKYGELLFLRPGRADNWPSITNYGWINANCKEPGTTKTVRTTSPYFVEGSCDITALLTAKTNESCSFRVPSTLWTGFGRSRKFDGAIERANRHPRLVAGITLRVLEAGRFRAATLASLMNLRWYKKGPPLVRGTITPANVEAIFNVIEFAKPALLLGPDVAGGWKSLIMSGGTDKTKKCTIAGGGMRFSANGSNTKATLKILDNTMKCTTAWLAPYFGPVTEHLNEGPPVAP